MKPCTSCNHVKPDTDFYPDHRENYRHRCKECLRAAGRDYHCRNASRSPEEVETPDHKTCSSCRDELPITDFYRDRTKKDGHRTRCKGCLRRSRTL